MLYSLKFHSISIQHLLFSCRVVNTNMRVVTPTLVYKLLRMYKSDKRKIADVTPLAINVVQVRTRTLALFEYCFRHMGRSWSVLYDSSNILHLMSYFFLSCFFLNCRWIIVLRWCVDENFICLLCFNTITPHSNISVRSWLKRAPSYFASLFLFTVL